MHDCWKRLPPPLDHRSGESGDYRQRRVNGRLSPLAKACLSAGTGLFLLFIAGLSGYAFTQVSGDATFAKDGVIRHEVRIGHVEETQKKLLTGQRDIIKLLFIQPADRKRSDIDSQD
ncbi:hypothetical protein LCGC14_1631650 [marine sediment metagenome]|uniref:Uncharacterized protein n=1 Tax=marine sediment metagenome TaxID=412755 RepID=A0A0F9KI17_9ZZZZ